MPTYEFKCDDCETITDQRRRIEDRDEPQPCPFCLIGDLRRQLAAPRVRVVGGTPKSNDTYNYADRFTADVTGKHMEEVAESGLHTPLPKRPG